MRRKHSRHMELDHEGLQLPMKAPDTDLNDLPLEHHLISTESWSAELEDIGRLVDVPLDGGWETLSVRKPVQVDQDEVGSDAAFDYALKRVARGLQENGKIRVDRVCDYKSWILILELLRRCSVSCITRVVVETRFLALIESALVWMRDTASDDMRTFPEEQSGNSSEWANDPVADHPQPERDMLLISICRVLEQLINLTEISSYLVRAYAVTQLKHTLKITPDSAAIMLGSTSFLSNLAIQSGKLGSPSTQGQSSDEDRSVRPVDLEASVIAPIRLWKLATTQLLLTKSEIVHRAYNTYGLIPTLLLLRTCTNMLKSSSIPLKVNEVVEDLRTYLKKHFALPYRQIFLEKAHLDDGHLQPDSPIIDHVVEGLMVRRVRKRLLNSTDDQNAQRQLYISTLSRLFAEAIRSRPRHSAKLRKVEDPWLDKLFLDIVTISDRLDDRNGKPRGRRRWKELIILMLQTCKSQSVFLSTQTCRLILEDYAGVLDRDGQRVEWDLLSHCLTMDGDFFISNMSDEYGPGKRNKYLQALLQAVNRRPSAALGEFQVVSKAILIPLFHAFANARQIPQFVELWISQLRLASGDYTQMPAEKEVKVQNAQKKAHATVDNEAIRPESIWEDEQLLHEVSLHVESLTSFQIREMLSSLSSDISTLNANRDTFAAVTILDSILRGVILEDTIAELVDCVPALYELVSTFVQSSETLRRYEWRLWHLLTVISHRWVHVDHTGIARSTSPLIERALELFRSAPEWSPHTEPNGKSYRAHYHAFEFLFSLRLYENFSQLSDSVAQAVDLVLKLMQSFCEWVQNASLSHSTDTTLFSPEVSPNDSIRTVQELYVWCIQLMCKDPNLLSSPLCSTPVNLLDQLYTCALHQQHENVGALPTSSLDYVKLWNDVLLSLPNISEARTQHIVSSFLCDKYLRASKPPKDRACDLMGRDYQLAYSSLRLSQPDAWSSGHRSRVAGSILTVLKKANFGNESLFVEHLNLLTRILKGCAYTLNEGNSVRHVLWSVAGNEQILVAFSPAIGVAVSQLARAYTRDLLRTDDLKKSKDHASSLHDDSESSQTPRLRVLTRCLERLPSSYNETVLQISHAMAYVMSGEILTTINRHWDDYSAVTQVSHTDFEKVRGAFLEGILRRIDHLLNEARASRPPGDIVTLIHLMWFDMKYLAENAHSLMTHHTTGKILSKTRLVSNLLLRHRPALPTDATDRYTQLLVGIARVRLAMQEEAQCDSSLILETAKLLDRQTDVAASVTSGTSMAAIAWGPERWENVKIPIGATQERDQMIRYIQRAVLSMTWGQRLLVLQEVRETTEGQFSDYHLYIIRSIVLSDSKATSAAEGLSAVFDDLKDFLSASRPFASTILALQCLAALLAKHHRLVSQHQVESTLSIIITLSQAEYLNQFGVKRSAHITTALTRLFHILLRVHRIRLGGRSHILILALTSLLNTLFVPYPNHPDDPDHETALKPTHASEYARLLTTICDPTVSAVIRKKLPTTSGAPILQLNDETKKAKREAGAFMVDWMQKYCAFHQHGKLSPEMRAALMPGVWAVLDVVAIETERVKALSERMGEEERGVFRGVWAEWQRQKGG